MSHHRRAVGAAILLNTAIVVLELGAGLVSRSLSLLTDGIHNLSDELALACIYLAFLRPGWLGRQTQRTANAGVAVLLRDPARNSATVRLAYLHNRGDVAVSLIPALAGTMVAVTGRSIIDSLTALAVASWLILLTLWEIRASSTELLWPETMTCNHDVGPR